MYRYLYLETVRAVFGCAPNVDNFVPENHMENFVRNLVVHALDLRTILSIDKGDKGYPTFHPAMTTALLFAKDFDDL